MFVITTELSRNTYFFTRTFTTFSLCFIPASIIISKTFFSIVNPFPVHGLHTSSTKIIKRIFQFISNLYNVSQECINNYFNYLLKLESSIILNVTRML